MWRDQVWILTSMLMHIITVWGQYNVHRQDPFRQLSATLQTYQRASCDGEAVNLECPTGTKISIQLVQYGRSKPSKEVRFRVRPHRLSMALIKSDTKWLINPSLLSSAGVQGFFKHKKASHNTLRSLKSSDTMDTVFLGDEIDVQIRQIYEWMKRRCLP